MRRYCRSIELCDNYLRGYYGLKLASKELMDVLPKAGDAAGLPTPEQAENLNELATLKLWEIVKRGFREDRGWEGNDQAELIATRELLDRDELDILKDASKGK